MNYSTISIKPHEMMDTRADIVNTDMQRYKHQMPYLRYVRAALFESWDEGYLSDEEFFTLYDLNQNISEIDYLYWKFDRFDLDMWDDTQCWYQFRFIKNNIYRLKDALRIPDIIRTNSREGT